MLEGRGEMRPYKSIVLSLSLSRGVFVWGLFIEVLKMNAFRRDAFKAILKHYCCLLSTYPVIKSLENLKNNARPV